jgi:comEA protein
MKKWFTPKEQVGILFLLLSLTVGLCIYLFKLSTPYFAPELKIRKDTIWIALDSIQSTISLDSLILRNEKLNLPFGKVSLNLATKEELKLIPGIGEVLAEEIINYRVKHGKFTSLEELIKIKGIGRSKLNKLKRWLTL